MPAEALTKLATDAESSVRLAVIANPGAPVELATSIAARLLAWSADKD